MVLKYLVIAWIRYIWFQFIHMTPIFNSHAEMEDLPDSVQSVISSVLREDDLGPQLLSNPVAVEDLLHRFEPGIFLT